MTISDTTPRVQYTVGGGGQTAFTVSFQFFAVTDLAVYNGTTKLTYAASPSGATQYSVAGAGASSGGTVTLGAAVASTTITIVRDVPVARSTDFPPSGPFQINSLNDELDKFTAMVKEREDQINRSVLAPETDPTTIDLTLPVKAARATKALGFDSDGDPVVSTKTLAQIETGSTEAAASAAAAATSATASANSSTASANSATASAASAATAETHAGNQSVDLFNGTGSQTAFTLSATPASENNTSVYISGVYQQKNTYSVSGTTLTFSTAPPSGTGNIEVMHISTQSLGVDPSIGSVTTGDAGSSAAVSITSGGVLSFTIPKGDNGATGSTGSTGATGSAATVAVGSTTTGDAGTSASVANSGSSSAATFNFTIPKGDTGTAGNAATIAVGSTTTGNAGTSASVANSGSSSAATFNFTIPRGDTGATGSTGAAGANGVFSAIASQAEAEAGSDNAKGMSSLRVKQSLDANAAPVTLAGSLDYLTLSGQEITRGAIVLSTDVSGTLPVANGGSGATSLTDGGILLGSGTGAITAMAVLGDGEMIVGDGTTDPVAESGATLRTSIGVDAAGTDNSTNVTLAGSLDYLTLSGQEITRGAIVLTTDVSGTLPVANGGTGAGTFAANGILYGNGTSAIAATAVGTDGQILTSNGSGVAPTFQDAAGGGATSINGLSDAAASGSNSLYLGTDVGNSNTQSNTGVGQQTLQALDGSAYGNVAVGQKAGKSITSGINNVALGPKCSEDLTTGSDNFCGSVDAAKSLTSGSDNIVIGANDAGENLSSGTHNTILGSTAGKGTATNIGCTILGFSANPSSNSVNHEVTLGSSSVGALRCQVTSITALSDRRDKKDIVPLLLGLDFINSLNPVKFTWNMRDGGKVGQQEAGFIAQELDEAQIAAGAEDYLDIVLRENPEKLEAAPGKLIPVLVKAIQDLSAEVETLKEQVNG